MDRIGKRLQKLRLSKGLTAKKVAQAVGMPESTYRAWESGRAITGEPYAALADLFEVSINELLTGKKPSGLDKILPEIEQLERGLENLKATLNRLF